MRHFIYGYDKKNPCACARDLKQRGITAVVDGSFSEEAVKAFQDEQIELYLCFGAHSLGEKKGDTARYAQSPAGEGKIWFSSACPLDAEIAGAHLEKALAAARSIPSLKGIFVDGARFASFASPEGFDAFFTCFCPRCMQKMQEIGLNGEGIRDAVARLAKNERLAEKDLPLLGDWLRFREETVKAYMDYFTRLVHEKWPHLKTGAFIFAPSLARFVGQTMNACQSLDIISPMLYRAYPFAEGPACLNHEWAAFYDLLGKNAPAFRRAFSPLSLPEGRENSDLLLQNGFTPAEIGRETAMAKAHLFPHQILSPIIQQLDPLQQETAREVLNARADGVGYFAYSHGSLPPILK